MDTRAKGEEEQEERRQQEWEGLRGRGEEGAGEGEEKETEGEGREVYVIGEGTDRMQRKRKIDETQITRTQQEEKGESKGIERSKMIQKES